MNTTSTPIARPDYPMMGLPRPESTTSPFTTWNNSTDLRALFPDRADQLAEIDALQGLADTYSARGQHEAAEFARARRTAIQAL
jgi:hypothetical protein